jgi:hypothetical protein
MKSTKLLSWEVGFLPFLMGAICGTAMGVGLYAETLRYDRQQIHNAAEKQRSELNEEVRLLKLELTNDAIARAAENDLRVSNLMNEQNRQFETRLTKAGACRRQQDDMDQLTAYAAEKEAEVDTVRRTFGSALGKCTDKSRGLTAELKALKAGAK